MKTIFLSTDDEAEFREIDNELEALQAAVGGNIEVVHLPTDSDLMIVDEEGRLKDKPMKLTEFNEAKEKEPVPSANDTSSEQNITPVILTTNDTTEPPKSQDLTLTGIKMMMELEAMLGEVFGREAEIIDINADGEHCDIGFAYRDRKYCLLFAEREEVPEYGNDQH